MSPSESLTDLFNLQDRVIVITGAAGFLGAQHAEAIAAYGGHPVLLDLTYEPVHELAGKLNEQYGVRSVGYAVDITNEGQIDANVREIIGQFGKIDGLVNNAANNPKMESDPENSFSRLESFPLAVWNADLAVGLTGAFLCAKYYGAVINQNPKGGVILNVSSDLGLIAPDQRLYRREGFAEEQQPVKPVTYSVVKTGLIGLTRYLATYWPSSVRCNALCPGGVENAQPESFLREVSTHIPMGRLARVDELQGALIWMLSDASTHLNGAIVPIDGGRTAW